MPVPLPTASASAESWMTELHTLLQQLEKATAADQSLPPVFSEAIDQRLVQVRLGVAAGLFAALQCKHAATAGHALRVAIGCSGWAMKLALPDEERNAIEVAALLHDVGVIGVPDGILRKPGRLDDDEAAIMARSRKMSLEILRRSCASPKILEIVENVSAWFDGTHSVDGKGNNPHLPEGCLAQMGTVPFSGETIPLGSRMIAVVEAFDAMTTDRVFRPARSRERAMAELYECSGTQFDPDLVAQFDEFSREDPTEVRDEVAYRWLRQLTPAAINSAWGSNVAPPAIAEPAIDAMFQGRLLDAMYDAVAFIDAAGRIVLWNHGAERLTGLMGDCVRGELWNPVLLGIADEKGDAISEADCPAYTAIRCGAQSLRRLTILGRRRQTVAVDSHAIPVIDQKGVTLGAILLLHDASSEISLEQRCQSLHDKATKDPLTQIANRAEFDRVHSMFVAAHRQQQVPCSLLMLDLDRFKMVNDTYGHQAGDDAIRSIAALLKSSCRPGDLVARYGGEEFVVLCADCDNAAAVRHAEKIRDSFGRITQQRMNGRTVTVSIGVTEIQPGDTPETMLRRADRALLTAKANGRNTVVQLGGGVGDEPDRIRPLSRRSRSAQPREFFAQNMITPVPVKIAAEKLRGFVADHRARIVAVEENRARLEIDDVPTGRLRRLTDRPTTFCIEVRFEEERVMENGDGASSNQAISTRTKIGFSIATLDARNRRQSDATAKARDILISFRSYMMATECEPQSSSGVITCVKRMLTPWLGRKQEEA